MYVTHLPCLNCAALITYSRVIKRVFFQTMYGDSKDIHDIFINAPDAPIELLRVMPSGAITTHDRSSLYEEKDVTP